MLVPFLLQAVVAPTIAASQPWATVSRRPARGGVAVEVAFLPPSPGDASFRPRVRITRAGSARVLDAGTCPALAGVVAAFRTLPMPAVQVPDGDITVVADGVGYAVTAPVGYDGQLGEAVTFRSNLGTPLAGWVEAQLAALDGCVPPDP